MVDASPDGRSEGSQQLWDGQAGSGGGKAAGVHEGLRCVQQSVALLFR